MTKEDISKTTKQKILEIANDLFASNGYNGTSVREIATGAGVNLAAINYHFTNKETLYWKVFEHNYQVIKNGVEQSGKNTETTADLAIEVFKFFVSSESAMMNIFKMFLSDAVAAPEEGLEFEQEKQPGPPGQEVFMEKIKHDIGDDIPVNSQKWAVKMIFSLLVHFGVITNTKLMKRECEKDETLKPEAIEKSLRHSVNAHLNYLKENPNL